MKNPLSEASGPKALMKDKEQELWACPDGGHEVRLPLGIHATAITCGRCASTQGRKRYMMELVAWRDEDGTERTSA